MFVLIAHFQDWRRSWQRLRIIPGSNLPAVQQREWLPAQPAASQPPLPTRYKARLYTRKSSINIRASEEFNIYRFCGGASEASQLQVSSLTPIFSSSLSTSHFTI